jgi:hypothetical protein
MGLHVLMETILKAIAAKISLSPHFFSELIQEISDKTSYYPGRGLESLMEFHLSTRQQQLFTFMVWCFITQK